MKKLKICCDHCKKDLDEMHDYIDVGIEVNHEWIETDLCADCFAELWRIIEKFCNNKSES